MLVSNYPLALQLAFHFWTSKTPIISTQTVTCIYNRAHELTAHSSTPGHPRVTCFQVSYDSLKGKLVVFHKEEGHMAPGWLPHGLITPSPGGPGWSCLGCWCLPIHLQVVSSPKPNPTSRFNDSTLIKHPLQFYLCTSLGLSLHVQILRGDGRELIQISPHFIKRVMWFPPWSPNGAPVSYSSVNNVYSDFLFIRLCR